MISSEEAFLIFDKWRSEGKLVYVWTVAPDGQRRRFQASFSEVLTTSRRLILWAEREGGETVGVEVELGGATFEYADTRETADPDLAAMAWVCFLSAFLPDGGAMMFGEPK